MRSSVSVAVAPAFKLRLLPDSYPAIKRKRIFLFAHPRWSPLLPIPGTSSLAHLEENMAAEKLQLSPDEWKRIEDLVRTS